LLDAELELAKNHNERLVVYKTVFDTAKQIEAKVEALHKHGARGGEDEKYYLAVAFRLEVQIAQAREKRRAN
jgi:hypothetical protein